MNIFIDAGAYRGLYIRRFVSSKFYKPGFIIYAFECNPTLSLITYGKDVMIIRKAIWIYDGKINFYISKKNPDLVQGSTLYKSKTTGNLDTENPVTVECIDFSRFLYNNISKNDNLIVKMNIEGAEYKILEKCISDNTITLIKKLFIQWHYDRITAIEKERHNNLVKQLESKIDLYNGFGHLK